MLKLRSNLFGKGASYLVNAVVDAQIEEALIYYIKNSRIKTNESEVKERVKDIIKKTSREKKKEKLLVKAFTYKWVNGYVNFWYSKIFYRIINEEFPIGNEYYKNAKGSIFNHFINIIFYYPDFVKKYAKELKLKASLQRYEIKKEILEVQKINIKVNNNNSIKIEKKLADTWKIKKLIEWSKKDKYPEVFLKSARITQLSAAGWDRIYSTLL